jgi:hypothetical protein
MRKYTLIVVISFCCNLYALAVYHVGNSLTDHAYGIVDIAEAKGYDHFFGRHMIPGAPLEWLANHICEGMIEPAALGTCADQILRSKSWDAFVMQHRQRSIQSDVTSAKIYMNAAFAKNPNCQAYFFQEYPYPREGDYVTQWLKTDPNLEHTRIATQLRADALSKEYPGKKKVLIVPIGEVLFEIHKGIKEGKPFPEVSQPSDVFADSDHFNNKGMYISAVTHFATIYAQNPSGAVISGLRFWKGPYSVSSQFAEAVWTVVWRVVSTHPYTGLSTTSNLNRGTLHLHARAKTSGPTHSLVVDIQGRACSPTGLLFVNRGRTTVNFFPDN